ncbi:MAG: AIR synthase-related protein [Flavobacteriaceae bacterium]|nr:AIR synthase-related protein [Flavobacteriaceae bacterium]
MDRYLQRGVSSSKKDVHSAIQNIGKGLFPKAFCKVLPDFITGSREHCLLMHADGSGTKSALAYVYWKETGDLSVWEGIAQDAIVMNTDDLMCVGAIENLVVSSTIGRNQKKIPSEVIKAIIHGTECFLENLRNNGIDIYSGGGETADLGDLVRTIVVDASMICRLERNKVIDNSKISSGNVIVGLASWGKANYEDQYNSGIGCNGLTSARHDLFNQKVKKKYPESFDSSIPEELTYTGDYFLTDSLEDYNSDIGKFVLSPTRTYLPVVKTILKQVDYKKIYGMIHCTGGGQIKVLNFIDNLFIIKDNLFQPPKIFELIRQTSNTPLSEMYQVFNMGHRLEFYVDEHIAQDIIEISKSFSIEAKIIGRVESRDNRGLEIRTSQGIVSYP